MSDKNDEARCSEEDRSNNADHFDEEITGEDYGFVFDADGELKSVFMPTDFSNLPDKVLKVFKMCGIKDPRLTQVYTVH